MPGATPFFELHILPMFRLLDRDHMSVFFDLFDYDVVAQPDKAAEILSHLKGGGEVMPPLSHGGPWPDGWIAVFEAWIAAGYPRLGRTKGSYAAQKLTDGSVRLTAEIHLRTKEDAAWLERLASPANTAEYIVYSRPGQSRGDVVTIEENFDTPPQAIFVTDSEARKKNVPIEPPAVA
jgi:hypothetical protein